MAIDSTEPIILNGYDHQNVYIRENRALRKVATVPLFSLRGYGAKGDGASNDGPAIRKALTDAAVFAAIYGRATVVAEPGKNYRVVPLLVTGTAYTCWRGIAIPAGVTLDMQGSTLTAQHQSGSVDGCLVAPAGTESDAMVTDYGAASNWSLKNAVLATTSESSVTTGNLLVVLRCEGVTLENVSSGSAAAYHFLEFNNCRNVLAKDISILHDFGNGGAFPEVQFDNGNPAAPVGSYSHTAMIEDITLENLQMRSLTANAAQVRRIELGHGAATYRRIVFRGGYLAGMSQSGVGDYSIVDINSTLAVVCEDLLFDGVTFEHDTLAGSGSGCISIPDSVNVTLRGFEVRNCRFTGNYRSAVKVGSFSVTDATSANYARRRGIHIHHNYFAPGQDANEAGQTGTTRVICVQGCEDAVIENNYELSPATESNVTSNAYNSISSLNNKRCHIRNNTIVRQQAAIGDMASGDNNGIYIRVDNVLALSGTQEVVVEVTGNSIAGVHRISLYESADPSAWAAGAYTRIKGTRARNIWHTAGTVADQINLPIGLWPAPAGTLLTGAATTDDTAAGLYAADGGDIATTITTVNTLAGHIATAIYTTNMPTSAGQRAVLTPSRAV